MPHSVRYLSASLLALTLLSSCEQRTEGSYNREAQNEAALNDLSNADKANGDKVTPALAAGSSLPALIPPKPGESGGLPDDRRPLDESPIDPASIRGAGLTLEKYALALESKDYETAYALWGDEGGASGLTKAKFAGAYDKYLTINMQIGRPETGGPEIAGSEVSGPETARVPVQLYGRLKNSNNEPYNMIGSFILARSGDKDMPWEIIDSDLQPRGVVREAKSGSGETGEANIPPEFHGRWAKSTDLCRSDADTMTLRIGAEKLEFWESQAIVKSVQKSGRRITVTADYTGEGENWTRTTSYTLSADGKTLTSNDDVARVKCG
ncbi:hypothetical protein [Parasphingorhabdus sp.]|uniref:hypothetical protein n=1 Tax=Parasphingorhabdus sp. TaxID=2709688 RepID=UPI002F94B24F